MAEVVVPADVAGTVWKVLVAVGQRVDADEQLMILESMKMEIPVHAPSAGVVVSVLLAEQDKVEEGQALITLES